MDAPTPLRTVARSATAVVRRLAAVRRWTGMGDRAQTEVLGYALLIGLIVTAVSVTLLFGHVAINEHEQTASVEQAERGLAVLDERASRVALGESSVQQLQLGLEGNGGTLDVKPNRGWLRVEIINIDTGVVETNVTNQTLGAVVYENRETSVAYQAGGVWRADDGNSVMVSPPAFDYRSGGMTIPIVTTGGESVYDDVQIRQTGPSVREFPNASAGLTNRVKQAKVVVTVHSEYYEAWAQFFREETNGLVYVDHAAERATLVLLAIPDNFPMKNGISATSGTGKLELAGTGAYTDSYNSSVGPYEETKSGNGTVWAAGDVELSGDSTINGSVESGNNVTLDSSSARVEGDVNYTNTLDNAGTITGETNQISGVAALPPIDGYVQRRAESIREDNDNDQTSLIADRELTVGKSETAELGPGRYYLESLEVSGGHLTLNTSEDQNVSIALEDWAVIEKNGGIGGNLTVEGNGTVNIYALADEETDVSITGAGSRDVNFHVGKESTVHVPLDKSPQFRVYAVEDFVGTVAGSSSSPATFHGVFYAPAGRSGDGYVYTKQSNIYGSVITANLTVGQYGRVHYDKALNDVRFPPSPTVSRLRYMHVAVHRINVTSA